MKEFFEKIVMDSIDIAKDNLVNEIKSSKKKNDKNDFEKISDDKINTSSKHDFLSEQYNHKKNIGIINAYSRNRRLNIMVVSAALGLLFCLIMLTSYKGDLSGEVVGIISTVSGIFGACLKDAYSFEFGSSRGSKDKDEKISSAILERLSK